MMELFDRVLNKSPVFISYFNKYFVDNFDESIANINVKLYCQTFLVLLSLMLNIHLFLWHINTATFLAENNMNQHTDGRLAILNADHMFSFDSMVVLKISLSKKNPVCWCYKHTVFFFYKLFWKKFQIIRHHIDSNGTIKLSWQKIRLVQIQ